MQFTLLLALGRCYTFLCFRGIPNYDYKKGKITFIRTMRQGGNGNGNVSTAILSCRCRPTRRLRSELCHLFALEELLLLLQGFGSVEEALMVEIQDRAECVLSDILCCVGSTKSVCASDTGCAQ